MQKKQKSLAPSPGYDRKVKTITSDDSEAKGQKKCILFLFKFLTNLAKCFSKDRNLGFT